MINYQGKLLKPDGTAVADGTYGMKFAIYAVPTGGDALWWEQNPTVQVKKGLFSVLLGSVINLPANIFDSPNRFFGVTVGADPEMTPRQQITTAAYAFKAGSADTVADGAVTTAKISDGAVTVSKVSPEAWKTWTPSIHPTGQMTFTPQRVVARYIQIGKTVHFHFEATGTVGGTGSYSFYVGLPVEACHSYNEFGFSGAICGDGVSVAALILLSDYGTICIRKFDSSAFNTGTTPLITANGTYETL